MRNQTAGKLRTVLEKLNPVYEEQFIEISGIISEETSLMQEEVGLIEIDRRHEQVLRLSCESALTERDKTIESRAKEIDRLQGIIDSNSRQIQELKTSDGRGWKAVERQAEEIEELKKQVAYYNPLKDLFPTLKAYSEMEDSFNNAARNFAELQIRFGEKCSEISQLKEALSRARKWFGNDSENQTLIDDLNYFDNLLKDKK